MLVSLLDFYYIDILVLLSFCYVDVTVESALFCYRATSTSLNTGNKCQTTDSGIVA